MGYSTSTLCEDQAENIASTFKQSLYRMVDNAQAPVEALDLISERDVSQIMEWNQSQPQVVDAVIHNVFKSQAQVSPDAQAISSWDGDFTYLELDELSDILAQHLARRLTVGPEVIVPLCFDKSRWTVVVMMAVLKAGGVIVCLGPSQPISRLEAIIQQCHSPPTIITEPKYAYRFEHLSQTTFSFDPSFFATITRNEVHSLPLVNPSNAAYIIFTSGSTGTPKGIVTEHRALCTSSQAHGSTWHINPGTRVFNFAAYTFDISTSDIFTSIMRGATVCMPSEDDRLNDLGGAIAKAQANWTFLTPTVATLLADSDVPSLRTMVLGGEASTKAVLKAWAHRLKLIVGYGPAETTPYCMGAPPATTNGDPSNLGRPFGCVLWICDPLNHDQLAPIGAVGELLIEGPMLAREYLNDPQRTKASFIENPAWANKGSTGQPSRRFYKTGDLVRWNIDGTMNYVARKDTQVKVRGQRVELQEIEHHLMTRLPDVQQAVVEMVKIDSKGSESQLLVAFIHTDAMSRSEGYSDGYTAKLDSGMQAQFLKSQASLSDLLPSYMVPAAYVPMRRTPLTANGKLDRAKLRHLAGHELSDEQWRQYSLADVTKRAPSTPMEKKLQALWSRVLDTTSDSIGVDDSFFRLGGDSITAIRLVRAGRAADLSLSVADIFQQPVLGDLARLAIQSSPDQITAVTEYKPYSLLETPDRGTLLERNIFNNPLFGKDNVMDVMPTTDFQSMAITGSLMRSPWMVNYFSMDGVGPLNLDLLKESCAKMVNALDILRTSFVLVGNEYLQVVLKSIPLDLEVYETDKDVNEFSHALQKADLDNRFEPSQNFVKFMVIKHRHSQHHHIIMRMSHAQYDGLCLPDLWKALSQALNGATLDTPSQFSTFMLEQKRQTTSEAYSHWRHVLSGSSVTAIAHRQKPAYKSTTGQMTKFARRIQFRTLPSHDFTFAVLLKAAWAAVLMTHSTTTDIVFGTVISGRNLPDARAENAVGPCLNLIPVRVNLDNDKHHTAVDLLRFVQEQQISNMRYETLGFRKIMRECTAWPSWTHFGSIVQHQNLGIEQRVRLGETEYEISGVGAQEEVTDVLVLSTPYGDEVEVNLSAPSAVVPECLARAFLDALCDVVEKWVENPDMELGKTREFVRERLGGLGIEDGQNGDVTANGDVTLNGAGAANGNVSANGHATANGYATANGHQHTDAYTKTNGTAPLSATTTTTSHTSPPPSALPHKSLAYHSLVQQVWSQILPAIPGQSSQTFALDDSFFGLGGDMVAAGQVCLLLRNQGFSVDLEDFTECVSVGEQALLLAERGGAVENGVV
jgi:amino acid adenylation domain-containing protein